MSTDTVPVPGEPHVPPPPSRPTRPVGHEDDPSRDVQTLASVNGRAAGSLLLAMAWLLGLGSVAAMVLARRALREIDAADGRQTGRGVAAAGWLLGLLGAILGLVVIGILLFGGDDVSTSVDFRLTGP
ncbi:MAG: hypothetical protein M0P31_02825 [Solirubrobacteraceae bacterium]|nr:hypothetical protein [Solirubrobacteraceae bacterium]